MAEWLNSWRKWSIILLLAGSLVAPAWFLLCPEAKLATRVNRFQMDLPFSYQLNYGVDSASNVSIMEMDLWLDVSRDQKFLHGVSVQTDDYMRLLQEPIPYQTSETVGEETKPFK